LENLDDGSGGGGGGGGDDDDDDDDDVVDIRRLGKVLERRKKLQPQRI
jgi:hypothetical protein